MGNTYQTLKELIKTKTKTSQRTDLKKKIKPTDFKEMISVLLLISRIIPMDMSKTHKELENNESFNIKSQKLLNSSKTPQWLWFSFS